MSRVYKGDVGTLLTVDCGTDISAATTTQIKARLPNKQIVTRTASLSGTNYLTYNLIAADTATVGTFKGQAYVELPSGQWYGETFTFEISERL